MATSLKALTLDPLHLCSSAGDLSLSLISTVHLKFSSITLHASDALHDIDALQLLLSEGLCITTGAECCIEIYLTLDGQEPINHYREYINETATKYFRDLPWSQLSLSASIVASQAPCSALPNIKLNLCRILSTPSADAKLAALLKSDVEYRPPKGVVCAEVKRFQLRFDIQLAGRSLLQHKRLKMHTKDDFNLHEDQAHTPLLMTHSETQLGSKETEVTGHGFPGSNNANRVMNTSMSENISPVSLSRKTRPTPFSMNASWPISEVPAQVLHEDEEMLLEELESIISSVPTFQSLQNPSLKRPSPDDLESGTGGFVNQELKSLDFLIDHAFRIAVGGYSQGCKGMSNTLVGRPRPRVTLDRIVPDLWCPGFKQFMNQNARFVPSISRSMSSSWRLNAQSPNLRQKLAQLENEPNRILSSDAGASLETTTASKLESTIQARLWAMMQQKLHDPLSARRILAKYTGSCEPAGETPLMTVEQDHSKHEFEPFTSPSLKMTWDALGDDILEDDELMMLEDFQEMEEIESRATEQNTEDMLLSDIALTDLLSDDGEQVQLAQTAYVKDKFLTLLPHHSNDVFSYRNTYRHTVNSDEVCFSGASYRPEGEVKSKALILSEEEMLEDNHDEMLLGSDCSQTHQKFLRS